MSDNATPTAPTTAIYDGGLLRGSISLAAIALIGLGLLYPLTGVGLGQALFPDTANGSLIKRDGKVVGSELVAQPFLDARYFQPRPSAADYNPMAVSGSNQARTNQELRKRINDNRVALAKTFGVDPVAVPSDLVTESGGGIDPHISVQAAAIQVNRVAKARGLSPEAVKKRVAEHTQGKQLGLLGQPRVNVLELNLALDGLFHAPAAGAAQH